MNVLDYNQLHMHQHGWKAEDTVKGYNDYMHFLWEDGRYSMWWNCLLTYAVRMTMLLDARWDAEELIEFKEALREMQMERIWGRVCR